MIYTKPLVKSYRQNDILEESGAAQTNYTLTINPQAGNTGGNIDGSILYAGGDYDVFTDGWSGEMAIGIAMGSHTAGLVHGYTGFDISDIQGTVVSATLKIYDAYSWENPYVGTGNLMADHVNFGDGLDGNQADFSGNTLAGNIGTVSTSSSIGYKPSNTGLDVTQYVQNDLDAGRTISQFRFKFAQEPPTVGDGGFVYFNDGEDNLDVGYKPTLTVEYR